MFVSMVGLEPKLTYQAIVVDHKVVISICQVAVILHSPSRVRGNEGSTEVRLYTAASMLTLRYGVPKQR